jgi:hypothetical protein
MFAADGVDHCYAVFQIAGRSTIMQNDHAITLAVGDVALIDSARPVMAIAAVAAPARRGATETAPRPQLVQTWRSA